MKIRQITKIKIIKKIRNKIRERLETEEDNRKSNKRIRDKNKKND